MKIKEFPNYPGDREIIRELENKDSIILIDAVEEVSVVLGRVTSHNPDVNEIACKEDSINIYRRKGGGGCVLLFPGVLIINIVFKRNNSKSINLELFIKLIVEKILKGLNKKYPINDFRINGMGDLCIGNQKIMGSSVFASKDFFGYYSSLIVQGDLLLIEKYLGKASKIPEYRKERDHLEFVTKIENHHRILESDLKDIKYKIKEELSSVKLSDIY